MRRTLALCLLLVAAGLPFGAADAATIRSWDDANQTGGDLFNSLSGFGYETFENALLARQHIVLPGISELTANNLLAVDVFFWGSSEHILSASEQTVLSDFINAGGLIILETDSIMPHEQAAANSAYAALGLGAIDPTETGVASADQGTFANIVTSTTVGPLGDLRGQTWAGTPESGRARWWRGHWRARRLEQVGRVRGRFGRRPRRGRSVRTQHVHAPIPAPSTTRTT